MRQIKMNEKLRKERKMWLHKIKEKEEEIKLLRTINQQLTAYVDELKDKLIQ